MSVPESDDRFFCINCGHKINSLYKKYSETVLKLTECTSCGQIADKYVEYDIVVIIIDLILLNTMAYRHILLNTDFKHFWKLSVVLVLLEAYCNWALTGKSVMNSCRITNRTEPSLTDFEMNIEDLRFYAICLNVALSNIGSVAVIYSLTHFYQEYLMIAVSFKVSFKLVMKTITLASTGIFLQLPSIIWDISLYEYHLHFITLYTCLSQLLAYRVICQSPKIWCLFVIFSSHFCKMGFSTYLSRISDIVFSNRHL